MFMAKIKNIIATLYNSFLMSRRRFVSSLLFGILLISLVIGASYRIISVRENFEIINSFEHYVNMASHFWTNPGGFNFEGGLKMKEKPDDYVFSRHPKEPATGSFENEKGWEFILSLIFKEGTKGIQNLAMVVARYQVMLDLFVIVLLFYSGKSIAGPLGGSLAAILYALFKPSVSMVSWVSYYYWAIPFSALSIFFWTAIYKPKSKTYSLKFSIFLFLLYGMVMGFATSLRLAFLFLPLFLSPLIFFREKTFKRAFVLVFAMLLGQGILLAPQILITHKYYDQYTLSTRGKWHHVISGLSAYPNPFGIEGSGDLTAVNWAINRGGPDLNKVGIQEYDKFMKKEAIRLFKERPDIFIRNFKRNLYDGIMITPRFGARFVNESHFLGIMDASKDSFANKNSGFIYFFPWLVVFSIFVFFFFWQERFGALIAVVLQGLYGLSILCIYFPAADQHITVYFPVFVLLLAVSIAVLVKGAISIPEGFLRCWVNDKGFKELPKIVRKCFYEEWDREYYPARVEEESYGASQRLHPAIKWLLIFLFAVAFLAGLFIIKTERNITNEKLDEKTLQMVNSIIRTEGNGSFELWSNGESLPPDEWEFTYKKGGGIHRSIETNKVKIGISSAEVHASDLGNSNLVFTISNDKLYYLIGKTIVITAWVKSDNNLANKVYLSLNAGDPSRYLVSYYSNSKEWEKLTLVYKVPYDITGMAISLNIDNGADSPAYFDGIDMKVTE